MMAILMCFWTHRAIWVKSIATLELLEPLETLVKRAARSAASIVLTKNKVLNVNVFITVKMFSNKFNDQIDGFFSEESAQFNGH